MTKVSTKPKLNYPADLVWAAACAAYRINGGYNKTPIIDDDGKKILSLSNKDLVKEYLLDESHKMITPADYEQGQECRRQLVNNVTMAALTNKITEWGLLTARVAELETIDNYYDVSVIAAMPKSHEQNLKRESTTARLARCKDGYVADVGVKVELSGEVVKSSYSANYNTWFVTAITQDNLAVFFSYRENLKPTTHINFRGTVKRHADHSTQLNRVKIIEETK